MSVEKKDSMVTMRIPFLDRELWFNFVKRAKMQNKNVWDLIKPLLEKQK